MTTRRFHSKLEPIKTLRKDAEETVMRELAGELAAVEQLQAELVRVEQQLAVAHRPADGSLTGRDLAARHAYAERLQRDVIEARFRLQRQEANVVAARNRLLAVSRERQKVDRLDDRRRHAHEAESRRLEASERDEMSLLNHLRSELAS